MKIFFVFVGICFLAEAGIYLMTTEKTKLPEKIAAPRLVVRKAARRLDVFDGDALLKTYRIGLGFAPDGDKEIEGDGKTPLGEFYVFTKNPESKFFLSLGVSYPSVEDAERGLRENLISPAEYEEILAAVREKRMPPQTTRLGGAIYIHGGGPAKDWTWGCMALENEEMREIYDAVPVGAPVLIEP